MICKGENFLLLRINTPEGVSFYKEHAEIISKKNTCGFVVLAKLI